MYNERENARVISIRTNRLPRREFCGGTLTFASERSPPVDINALWAAVLHTLESHQHTVSSLRLFAGYERSLLFLCLYYVGWTAHTGVVISQQMSVCFFFSFGFLALPRPQKVTSLLAFELFHQGYIFFSLVGYCLEGICLRLSAQTDVKVKTFIHRPYRSA